jgi:hypothetical protein
LSIAIRTRQNYNPKKKKLRFDFFFFFFSSLGSADFFVMPFSLSRSLSIEVCIISKQGRKYFFLSDERKTDAPINGYS